MIQTVPVCLVCEEPITHSLVYAAPCDHEACPSACWHGTCLMSWREERDEAEEMMKAFFASIGIKIIEEPSELHRRHHY